MMNKRTRLQMAAVKIATSKSDVDFLDEYLVKEPTGSPSSWVPIWQHPRTDAVYSLSLSQAENTSDADLEACFCLVRDTSRKDYEASSRGWHPKSKRKEMREPEMRYILVKDSAGEVCGYTSLMPTLEEGEAVVYCYEIHLNSDLRGTGLSGLLMGFLDTVARNIEVMEKVMLTVFTCNTRAVEFYRRCGFEVDDFSPRPRKLRNGVVKEPDYAIMSKRIQRGQNGAPGDNDQADATVPHPAKMAKLGKENVHVKQSVTTQD